jgi:hypothetical protein
VWRKIRRPGPSASEVPRRSHSAADEGHFPRAHALRVFTIATEDRSHALGSQGTWKISCPGEG